ncbi:beta barrel domain-containing protein [Bacillus sp. Brlt_9]|uniref:beta barrel domain-containing protein n=1 Tax=Bacillus sp. Brlt_9 TaxID=3110916 RepID=UPI003F7BDF5A
MKPVEKGQTLFVSKTTRLGSEPNLSEYIVRRVTTTGFYANKKGSTLSHRFNKKTMEHKNRMGEHYKAYLNESEYYETIDVKAETERLKSEIKNGIEDLDVELLREIKNLLTNNPKK